MPTATELLMDQDRRGRDERYLHNAMEVFVNAWQPENRREAVEFHADLLRLVQAVHADAARPFADILTQAMRSNPLPNFISTENIPS